MPQKLSNTLKVFTLLLLSIRCEAQEFEWVNFFQGKSNQTGVSLSADPSGTQYSLFNFLDEIKFDTLSIKSNVNRYRPLVLKQNTNGDVLWYCVIKPADGLADIFGMASRFNAKGNLIVFVSSGVSIVIGSDTIKQKGIGDLTLFMIEFDQKGKMVSGKNLLGNLSWGGDNVSYPSHRFACDEYDNLYISLIFKGQAKIYDSAGVTNYGATSAPERYIIFKFSQWGQKFEWATELPYKQLASHQAAMQSLKVDIHGNVYALTNWGANTSIIFKGKTVTNPQTNTGIIFIWDKYGKDKNWFFIEASGQKSIIEDIAVYDSNSVFILGTYLGDSAKFDNIWKRNNKYGNYIYFALYDINGKLKWVKTEDTSFTTAISYSYGYGSISNYKDQYYYLSLHAHSQIGNPIVLDGQKYMPGKNYEAGLNMKLDARGNILWGFRTTQPFQSMATDEDNNLYFIGQWSSDSIRFGNYKAYPISIDSYIGKTFDYALYRGNIYSGPYCAGDSLFVPYTKLGNYADTNIFFAEISDEFGNFTGKEREIGRIKSNKDGTIRGVLPMFKVASSGNYRIRIRSTSPQAQSFYKKDSLRLLIFSRDKATPGPPEWICRGDTLQLNTYGGTKWKWSPKYKMDDSTLRKPMVWPQTNTTYKIIIADSSGCGAPDTAYKYIYIREDLKAVLNFKDTILCKNINLKIPVHFTGGDSNYHWQWYELPVSKSAILLGEGKLKQNDTLNYTSKLDSIKPSQKLALVLWDECTSKHDTVYINLGWNKPQYMTSKFKDTITCFGPQVSFNGKTNAPTGTYHWQWEEMNTNTVLSTFDFLKYKAIQTKKIKLSLISTCNTDVAIFTVFVKPPLKTSIYSGNNVLNDTAICMGESLKLNGIGKYGDSTNYEFKWYLDKVLFSTSSNLDLNSIDNFKPGDKKILKLVLNDNCSSWDDSISNTIQVLPSPIADFSFGKSCNVSPIQFTFKGTKPDPPVTTIFNWDFGGTGTSNKENPLQQISSLGKKKIRLLLVSDNGCSDTISKEQEVKPQSKADFTAKDVCESDSVIFINKSKDATGSTWKFGDGKNSPLENPKHKYSIITSTTFNVTLVALVSGGCSDSIVKPVTIHENPKSDFTYTNNGGKVDFKATQSGAKNYRWLFGNGDSAKVTNPDFSYTYKKSSVYNVCLKVINTAGCQSETCQQLSITAGISPMARPSGFKIYPNPNTGNFTLEIENPSNDISIEVYDLLGNLIKTIETSPDTKSYFIEMSVAKGIYLVKVKNGELVYNQKILISFDDARGDD